MGDVTRHRAFADLITDLWPDRRARIADVAGGKGYLNAELYRRGYRNVVTFDKRGRQWTTRKHYHYGLFDATTASRDFDLVVGMHPDAGTDEVLAYAARRAVPFAVVPCCVYPSAFEYDGPREYDSWCEHLTNVAHSLGLTLAQLWLPISGRNQVLYGYPSLSQESG